MRGYKKKNKKNEEKVLTLFQISSIIVNVLGGNNPEGQRNEKPRPLGQAVKTPPFHGGNRGSIPLGVTILNLEA